MRRYSTVTVNSDYIDSRPEPTGGCFLCSNSVYLLL
jgi:hypothetical protein